MKKIVIITVLISAIVLVGVSLVLLNNKEDKNTEQNKQLYRLFSMSTEEIEEKIMFKDRIIICTSSSNELKLLVGNNQKELENDFFDIKIKMTNVIETGDISITMEINKLWKELINSMEMYEEQYINEFLDLLDRLFLKKMTPEQREALYNYVVEQYLLVKNNNGEGQEPKDYKDGDIELRNVSENNLLILDVRIR